jgi:hypothetical protein
MVLWAWVLLPRTHAYRLGRADLIVWLWGAGHSGAGAHAALLAQTGSSKALLRQ